MIDHSHDLPIKRQAALVNISRGSAYYKEELNHNTPQSGRN
jgi:hypothetical protein